MEYFDWSRSIWAFPAEVEQSNYRKANCEPVDERRVVDQLVHVRRRQVHKWRSTLHANNTSYQTALSTFKESVELITNINRQNYSKSSDCHLLFKCYFLCLHFHNCKTRFLTGEMQSQCQRNSIKLLWDKLHTKLSTLSVIVREITLHVSLFTFRQLYY